MPRTRKNIRGGASGSESNICNQTKTRTGPCELIKTLGSKFCELHTCAVCEKSVSSSNIACEKDCLDIYKTTNCKLKKTTYLQGKTRSVKNIKSIIGCRQVKKVGGDYCERHGCPIPGCKDVKSSRVIACPKHIKEARAPPLPVKRTPIGPGFGPGAGAHASTPSMTSSAGASSTAQTSRRSVLNTLGPPLLPRSTGPPLLPRSTLYTEVAFKEGKGKGKGKQTSENIYNIAANAPIAPVSPNHAALEIMYAKVNKGGVDGVKKNMKNMKKTKKAKKAKKAKKTKKYKKKNSKKRKN